MSDVSRFTTGNRKTVQRMNEVVRAVNKANHILGDGIIKVHSTQDHINLSVDVQALMARMPKVGGSGNSGSVRRGKVVSVGTDSVTFKLLDSDGTAVGDSLTAYPSEHLGTNALSGDVWPKLATDNTMPVFLDVDSKWYIAWCFDDQDECDGETTTTAAP